MIDYGFWYGLVTVIAVSVAVYFFIKLKNKREEIKYEETQIFTPSEWGKKDGGNGIVRQPTEESGRVESEERFGNDGNSGNEAEEVDGGFFGIQIEPVKDID